MTKNVAVAALAQRTELSTAVERPQASGDNQIFGYQTLPRDIGFPYSPVFSGTQRAHPHVDHGRWQLEFFASPRSHVRTFVSEKYESRVYVWGIPARPSVSRADIAAWCAEVVAQRRFDRFREL